MKKESESKARKKRDEAISQMTQRELQAVISKQLKGGEK